MKYYCIAIAVLCIFLVLYLALFGPSPRPVLSEARQECAVMLRDVFQYCQSVRGSDGLYGAEKMEQIDKSVVLRSWRGREISCPVIEYLTRDRIESSIYLVLGGRQGPNDEWHLLKGVVPVVFVGDSLGQGGSYGEGLACLSDGSVKMIRLPQSYMDVKAIEGKSRLFVFTGGDVERFSSVYGTEVNEILVIDLADAN